MFQVFDNNKPADETGFPRLKYKGWDTSKFNTFEEAQEYANKWLGEYGPVVLQVNVPYNYSGYGDMIEIRKVE